VRVLHGRAPRAFAVAVGAAVVDAGEDLSPAVARRLPAIVERVRVLVARSTVRRVAEDG
jgi:hypothetical protein